MDWTRGFLLASATVAIAGSASAADLPEVSAHGPWTLTERNEEPGAGYVMYKREMPGSDFTAFRLEAIIDAPPDVVAAAAQRNIADPDVSQKNTTKTVLRSDERTTLVYSYIDLPFVSDRDLTTRTVRSFDAQSGSHRVEWQVTEDGPAPKEGVVRLQKSSGSWVFTPHPGGRTLAVYESHTDIGGSIPGWLLNTLMSETVVSGIETLRARVEQDRAQVAAGAGERPSRAQ